MAVGGKVFVKMYRADRIPTSAQDTSFWQYMFEYAKTVKDVKLFSEFLPLDYPRDVPDPYLGQAGFDRVIDIIEHGCPTILDHLLRGS